MTSTEIVPGVYLIRGKFTAEFGFISSYLVVDGEEALLVDPGTVGDPGTDILKAISSLGLSPKRALVGILCTHGHPDHVGGAYRLRRVSGAPLMIHGRDAELLENPDLFIQERLRLNLGGRLAMKVDRSPLRVNYAGQEPDRILEHGDEINVGELSLSVVHTGGHSAGHCVFLERNRGLLFSGDEINNFPDESRKFYVDLSGSLTTKLSAIDRISSLGIDYLLPAHDIPHILDDVGLQVSEIREGVVQFLDSVLEHLSVRVEADVEQLAFDLEQTRAVPVPRGLNSLLPTTIQVALCDLEKAGLVKAGLNGVWTLV